MNIKETMKNGYVIFDGAFGTYYTELTSDTGVPELANISNGEVVRKIHTDYINAGANVIRTNTFASNTFALCKGMHDEGALNIVRENIMTAIGHAKVAIDNKDILLAGSIGPINIVNMQGVLPDEYNVSDEYLHIVRCMLEGGVDIITFETFSDMEDIRLAIEYIKKTNNNVCVIVSFCINQFGYTNDGIRGETLLSEAIADSNIDGTGFNCGVGPGHLYSILKEINLAGDTFITALPNASYPRIIGNRMIFMKNEEYFIEKMSMIAELGVDCLGGCCGTRPDYIRMLSEKMNCLPKKDKAQMSMCSIDEPQNITDVSFYAGKDNKKLIAVELAPPLNADYNKVMDAANSLRKLNVDVLTFPDSPSGRTRADSILMATKVANETGMCVMPHICCRDKNAIAMRSLLLGAQINSITNFLVITGDPVPTLIRQDVKGVFNFDSCGLMKIMKDMNEETFKTRKMTYGGAINYGRTNIELEITRVKKKMKAGASFFFTQPVFCKEDVEKVRYIKEETGARILCGLMPLVSRKNALFIQNEMAGINVTDDIVAMFDDVTSKEEGERVGVRIAADMMELAKDFCDGYYLSIPFNRVYLVEKILKKEM